MSDSNGVFEEISSAFKFPPYFGWNWPAFSDCLCDLRWLPADRYLVVIENAGLVLHASAEERDLMYHTLMRAAQSWANPLGKEGNVGIPFNVLLNLSVQRG